MLQMFFNIVMFVRDPEYHGKKCYVEAIISTLNPTIILVITCETSEMLRARLCELDTFYEFDNPHVGGQILRSGTTIQHHDEDDVIYLFFFLFLSNVTKRLLQETSFSVSRNSGDVLPAGAFS